MYSFAHLADVHIGAFRHPILQDLVIRSFNDALEKCIQRKVDFVIVSGDLFDSNIPDMGLVNSAVKKIKEARDKGIGFYVVYGSHDFSPTQTSIIDILESAGLFKKVTGGKMEDGKLQLEFYTDERTKAKLCGISGRRLGIEKEYFEVLDRQSLQREEGFKIFVFHGAISEYKPEYLVEIESIPMSTLPKGFAYYAGGHIHEKFLGKNYGYVVTYPGALFGSDYRDLEKNAKGQGRGFYIIGFSDTVENIEFVPLSICDYELLEYDANGKNAVKVQNDLLEKARSAKPIGKLVLLKAEGEMSGGKTSDIDFLGIKKILKDNEALEVLLNYQRLTSREYAAVKVGGEDIREIEDRLFRENIGTVRVSDPKLKAESGVKLSRQLLNGLREPRKENEPKGNYETRIITEAVESLKLKEAFE